MITFPAPHVPAEPTGVWNVLARPDHRPAAAESSGPGFGLERQPSQGGRLWTIANPLKGEPATRSAKPRRGPARRPAKPPAAWSKALPKPPRDSGNIS